MKNSDYDKELRSLGYVDSGLSGSRGDYFILSYRPGAKNRNKMIPGLVEVHVQHPKIFEVHTPVGVFKSLTKAIEALIPEGTKK